MITANLPAESYISPFMPYLRARGRETGPVFIRAKIFSKILQKPIDKSLNLCYTYNVKQGLDVQITLKTLEKLGGKTNEKDYYRLRKQKEHEEVRIG